MAGRRKNRRWNGAGGVPRDVEHRGQPAPTLNWELLTADRASAEPDWGLVSCLCVTRGRYEQLQRAVRCFQSQTYQNRELVVVYEGLEDSARQLLESLGAAASLVAVPSLPKRPLGALRNIAIAASRGEYICSWDDDDWYSPQRLSRQLRQLATSQADACVLSRWLVLDEPSGRGYLSAYRTWEGSLLCRRGLPVIRAGYPPLARAEDRSLVGQLAARHCVFLLEQPELYVYRFHGGNTWGADHFRDIFRCGSELSLEDCQRLRAAVSS